MLSAMDRLLAPALFACHAGRGARIIAQEPVQRAVALSNTLPRRGQRRRRPAFEDDRTPRGRVIDVQAPGMLQVSPGPAGPRRGGDPPPGSVQRVPDLSPAAAAQEGPD